MKIDLNAIDREQFMVHQHILNGEVLWLVQPQHIGAKWTQANKIFRSSLWNNDGELVSAGFPKFTNWGENPDNFPVPKSLAGTTVVEKLDGSLLIVSKYKGQYILRTRGTSDASKLDNGAELEIFKQTVLPSLIAFVVQCHGQNSDTWNVSYLFEWVSPVQKIILNYGDSPDWYLVGAISHHDYQLWSQNSLDEMGDAYGLKRPITYTFPTVEELLANVETWKGKEGVVVYSKNGQSLHKVKGAWYLALHRMKEALSSIDKVIDVWFSQGCPPYQQFEKNITEQFDYELWQQCRGEASNICDAYKDVKKIIAGMNTFVNDTLKPLPTRRAQAEKVLAAYGNTNRASFVFALLDGKTLDSEQEKKLLYQVLK